MTTVDTFSMSALPAHLRIEYWNELADGSPTPTTFDAVERDRFSGRLRRACIDDLRVLEVAVGPSIVVHSRSHALRSLGVFALKLQIDGCSVTRQDGREARLGVGDFTLCDSLRPYEMFADVDNCMLVLSIPAVLLSRHVPVPERLTAVRMCGNSGMSGVLSDFLLSLWRRYPSGADADITPHVSQAVLNLMASAYTTLPRHALERPSMAAVHRVRIRAYVEKHLDDPELCTASVAAACRIKVHYLRKLFATEAETLAQFILRRRLEECAKRFGSPSCASLTITDVAFANGFSNMTHFGRVFRERYGSAPSEFRQTRIQRAHEPLE